MGGGDGGEKARGVSKKESGLDGACVGGGVHPRKFKGQWSEGQGSGGVGG